MSTSLSRGWDPVCLEPVQALCMLPLHRRSLCELTCIHPVVFGRHSFLWLLQSFCLSLKAPLGSPSGDLMETSHLGLSAPQCLTLSAHCLVGGLYISFHSLQEEASLLMSGNDTDGWAQQNVIQSHCIAMFL